MPPSRRARRAASRRRRHRTPARPRHVRPGGDPARASVRARLRRHGRRREVTTAETGGLPRAGWSRRGAVPFANTALPPGGSAVRRAASSATQGASARASASAAPARSPRRARRRPRSARAGRDRATSRGRRGSRRRRAGTSRSSLRRRVTSADTLRLPARRRSSARPGSSPTVPITVASAPAAAAATAALKAEPAGLQADAGAVPEPVGDDVDEQLADREEAHAMCARLRGAVCEGVVEDVDARCPREPRPRSARRCASR